MKAVILSDLHLGSRYFFYEQFEGLIKNIPETYELILNGDILDHPHQRIDFPHLQVLNLIQQQSRRRKVVWITGNHDNGYIPEKFGNVHFKSVYALEKRLLIVHGHDFDEIMPRNQAFMRVFTMLHKLRVRLGAKPVHVAKYAKRWKIFYKILRENVMKNAIECARRNGYQAVVCGHTHFPEDIVYHGIRYINTGAWTELPLYFLLVTDHEMTLKRIGECADDRSGRLCLVGSERRLATYSR
ncbi:MAG: metallophosphoesterase [Deltaproteobacteria bacterium]|nr:metallophosphoesterase [Deltaproteobacteria bacterium]MBW1993901.1 metallophosphoesterase [Deltaproteobacteria bacterium]MBW2150457.1 metallophosphoesterase [Deltaproteobacteria bacterium]